MTDLTLKRIAEILREADGDVNSIPNKEEILEYIGDLDSRATRIMKDISPDELTGAVSLIQSVVLLNAMNDQDFGFAMLLMADNSAFQNAMAVAIKFTVGIAMSEEWR